MLRRARLLLVTTVLLLAGCSSGGDDPAAVGGTPVETSDVEVPGDAATAIDAIEGREWVLDPAETSLDVDDSRPVTLSVSLGEVIGSAGCNTYQGPVEIDEASWAAGPFRLTQSTCSPEVMASETRVLDALADADEVAVEAERLVLSGPDDLVLTFRTDAPVDELTSSTFVGRWLVVAIGEESTGTPPIEGTDPLLVIDGSGSLGGVLGCNTVTGTWALDDEALTFADVAAGAVECPEPAGVGEQEAAIVAALQRTELVAYEGGDGLTLRGADGTSLLALRRAP